MGAKLRAVSSTGTPAMWAKSTKRSYARQFIATRPPNGDPSGPVVLKTAPAQAYGSSFVRARSFAKPLRECETQRDGKTCMSSSPWARALKLQKRPLSCSVVQPQQAPSWLRQIWQRTSPASIFSAARRLALRSSISRQRRGCSRAALLGADGRRRELQRRLEAHIESLRESSSNYGARISLRLAEVISARSRTLRSHA